MKKGMAIETVVFAVIAVIALLIFIILYKRIIPFTEEIISNFLDSMKKMFCNSIGKWHYLIPFCW